MNKDKSKPTAQVISEAQPFSTTLTLQQLNKKIEKEEADAEALRTHCKFCFKETFPVRRCGGHGAGGGGGGGGGSGSKSEEKASQGDDKSLTSKLEQSVDVEGEFLSETDLIAELLDSELQADEEGFDPDVIADLINNELLVISNDRKSMTLSLNLLCEPDSLSKVQRQELKKFMRAILTELKEFKEENQISENCLTIIRDAKGNLISLQITLPSLALYDAFIQRLANNLLPAATLASQQMQKPAPTPLATEPKPTEQAKEEAEEIFNPSPFSTKLEPW